MKMVRIIETATGKLESEMGPMDERRAERVASGININLNHEDYHVSIIDEHA